MMAFKQLELDPHMHLAWGSQPACGKVNRPTTTDLERVTCERCLTIGNRYRETAYYRAARRQNEVA